MTKPGLTDLYIVPMPEIDPPSWIAGQTPPVHRVRYWLWTRLYRVLDRSSDRLRGVASEVYERMNASGPQPIIDGSKLPKSVSFAWSDTDNP